MERNGQIAKHLSRRRIKFWKKCKRENAKQKMSSWNSPFYTKLNMEFTPHRKIQYVKGLPLYKGNDPSNNICKESAPPPPTCGMRWNYRFKYEAKAPGSMMLPICRRAYMWWEVISHDATKSIQCPKWRWSTTMTLTQRDCDYQKFRRQWSSCQSNVMRPKWR